MLAVDDHHWWYRGRRPIIRAELDRLPLPAGARVLDAGCGSGRTLEELSAYGEVHGDRAQSGWPPSSRARPRTGRGARRPARDAARGTTLVRPVTCLDVLEHTPDDRVALRELRRVTQDRRLAAADRPRLPGAVVHPRRGQPPLPPLRAPTLRDRRDGPGWRVAPADLVQQPAPAGPGSGGAASPSATGFATAPSTSPSLRARARLAERCARAPAADRGRGAQARVHAPCRPVAPRSAAERRRAARRMIVLAAIITSRAASAMPSPRSWGSSRSAFPFLARPLSSWPPASPPRANSRSGWSSSSR